MQPIGGTEIAQTLHSPLSCRFLAMVGVSIACTPLLGTNTVLSGLQRIGLDWVYYLALGTVDGASPPS